MTFLRFTAILIALTVGLPMLAALIRQYAGFNVSSSAFVIIPPMLAAIVEGQALARSQGRVPIAAEKLRFTGLGLLIVIVLNAVLFWIAAQSANELRLLFSAGPGGGLIAGLLAFFVALVAGSLYFFYGFGAATELRAIAKRAGRKK